MPFSVGLMKWINRVLVKEPQIRGCFNFRVADDTDSNSFFLALVLFDLKEDLIPEINLNSCASWL